MKKINKKSKYPFEITILPEDDGGGFLITFPDLPGCMADGETIEQAIENGQDAVFCWLAVAKERGQDVPEPGRSHSGQYVQRLPKSLHAKLAAMSKAENTSINQLAATLIAEGIGRLSASPAEKVVGVQDTIIQDKEKAEKALREIKDDHQTKSELLAKISQAIRTPMNVLMGMADMLVESSLDSNQKHLVEVFRGASENLLTLINDILDLPKIKAGQIELDNIDFNPRALLEKSVEILDVYSQEKGLALNYYIAPEIPNLVHGDAHRIRRVLTNLIGNAIKFTENGEILVRIEKDPEAESSEGLLFSVSDTGVGIPSEKLKSIFTSSPLSESSTPRNYGGTGLVLTICKSLVELMGGRIWAESHVYKGSTFSFTVLLAKPKQPEKTLHVKQEKLVGVKVLLLDHRASIRSMVSDQLVDWGMSVKSLQNSQEGLRELKKITNKKDPYQLLLVNSRLPTIGGFRFLNQVLTDINLHIPTVMMMPTDTRKKDIDQCRKLGVIDYMTKFLLPDILLEKIYAALAQEVPFEIEISKPKLEQQPMRKTFVGDNYDPKQLADYLSEMTEELRELLLEQESSK